MTGSASVAGEYTCVSLKLASPVIVGVDEQGDVRAKTLNRGRIGRAVRNPHIMRSLTLPQTGGVAAVRNAQNQSQPPVDGHGSVRRTRSLPWTR